MGIRFGLFVQRKNEEVYDHLLGGLKMRDFAIPVLAPVLEMDNDEERDPAYKWYGYGQVTDIRKFYEICKAKVNTYLEYDCDGDPGEYSYWSELEEMGKVAVMFMDWGVPVRIHLS